MLKFLEKICYLFRCKSNCSYNNEEFKIDYHSRKMSDFKLKNKDMERIYRILYKREIIEKNEYEKITEI